MGEITCAAVLNGIATGVVDSPGVVAVMVEVVAILTFVVVVGSLTVLSVLKLSSVNSLAARLGL